ncbi:MAG: CTP synthase [Armatimonadetes bacterium]|nr:CTP synthase [Armatimonadota bacterium]
MKKNNIKYIFITGGVVSSIGKGIFAASLGCILKNRGIKVTIQKLDPYINVDAGTMNPYQHGEVYVTEDGAETDLDLGHYERYINENLSKDNNITTGKIYGTVIAKERKGDYLGDTVRVIPHITNQIKTEIKKVAQNSNCEVCIIEIGGTVGDIESLPFLEAIRQMHFDIGAKNVLYIHVTLIPHLASARELKTKPTQHSVKELRSIGIQPNFIICRTSEPLSREMIEKIALYCDVETKAVIESKDVFNIYEVPLILEKNGLGNLICKRLNLVSQGAHLEEWKRLVEKLKTPKDIVKIILVGKYIELKDAYLSIAESLQHGGIANEVKVEIKKIDAEDINKKNVYKLMSDGDGILVPGGFGSRGVEGKIKAIEYARKEGKPYFGICYGMQWAVVEFARGILGWHKANSTEVDPAALHPVIDLLEEQKNLNTLGATMRLGAFRCRLKTNSLAYLAYGKSMITERHRHRYEFNNLYRDEFEASGLVISGINPDKDLVEIIELKNHPWFVAVQFHPEFKSRPNNPHPLFRDFIKASLMNKRGHGVRS